MRFTKSFFKKVICLSIISVLFAASSGFTQTNTVKTAVVKQSLYERLGGIFSIAAVVDHFSVEEHPRADMGNPGLTPTGARRAAKGRIRPRRASRGNRVC